MLFCDFNGNSEICLSVSRIKGPYIKYVGGGSDGFCGGHEIF